MPDNFPRLLYVVNIPRFFLSHRLPLALAARAAGYDVHVATGDKDRDSIQGIADESLPYHPIRLSQHGTNPLIELGTLLSLYSLYRKLKPDLLHHVSLKPVLYGGIAARLSGQRNIVHAISGLGQVLANGGAKSKALQTLSAPAFKLALGGESTRVVFQNPDDERRFVERGLAPRHRTRLIRGSGVDEERFAPSDEDLTGPPVVLFAGRLLWQKGVGEFVEAARRLRGKARFQVAGYEESSSPQNVSASQLSAWQAEGLIEWLGKRDDMPAVYAGSNIVCLPTSYGEGVPKVLIEAASCGRACVTTDSPGCREIVRQGLNGLLVPRLDSDALVAALQYLVENPAKRQAMGAAGRQIALDGYTERQIIGETLALYETLLTRDPR